MNANPERRLEGNAAGSPGEKRPLTQYFRESCLILVLLLGMFCLLAMILLQWSDLSQTTRVLLGSGGFSGGLQRQPPDRAGEGDWAGDPWG